MGTKTRIRSYDIKIYCEMHNVKSDTKLFNFQGKIKYSVEINPEPNTNLTEAWLGKVYIPICPFDALRAPRAHLRFGAMKYEIAIMNDRKVWVLVPKPENVQ